jgi:hypothetical protein
MVTERWGGNITAVFSVVSKRDCCMSNSGNVDTILRCSR